MGCLHAIELLMLITSYGPHLNLLLNLLYYEGPNPWEDVYHKRK